MVVALSLRRRDLQTYLMLKQSLQKFRLRAPGPVHTLIFAGTKEVVRVDVDAAGAIGVPEVFDRACKSIEELPEIVAFVAAEAGKMRTFGRNVWVLCDGLSIHSLSLPTVQTAGVADDLLIQALLFELEAATGFPTVGRDLAFALVGSEDDMNQYWVSLAPQDTFKQVQAAVGKAGGRLSGLLHPGGLPLPLSDGSGDWWRLEYWPETVLGLSGAGEKADAVQTFQPRAQRDLERWRKTLPAGARVEQLGSGAVQEMEAEIAHARLDDEGDLTRWLGAWAMLLTAADAPAVPVFRPKAHPYREYFFMGGVAAAALVICISHLGWFSVRANRAQVQLEVLKKTEAEIKTLRDAIKKKQDEHDKLRKEVAMLEGSQASLPAVVSALRRRPAVLLKALSEYRTEGIVIDEIATDQGEIMVRGIALRPSEANHLASLLHDRLQFSGWDVAPSLSNDLKALPEGGPWGFEIKLRDNGLEGFSRSPADNGRKNGT
jgi:cell division protein FtsB